MSARQMRLDGWEATHMLPTRSASISSDVMSSSVKSTGNAHQVPPANPPPAYIAQTEASDLISQELDRRVVVSPSALALLNDFLDHVLYTIISTSHSVSLGQLKAAVPAVLKPRLGKAALKVAEEELKEYIEDEEVEELYSDRYDAQPKTSFDTDLVWKIARLRCMVYARMGDLEEEDEYEWLEREHLLEQTASSPVDMRQSMSINPGAAIFLTAVIEYLGEQALFYAAQHSQKRHDSTRNQASAATSPEAQLATRNADVVLEGKDMNHVGRDSPLSRLWRSWRRNTRSSVEATSRSLSPDAVFSPTSDSIRSRTDSLSVQPSIAPIPEEKRLSEIDQLAVDEPSQIPLPPSEDGFDDEDNNDMNGAEAPRRPLSMPVMPGRFPSLELITDYQSAEPPAFRERSPLRPTPFRTRSNSLPFTKTPYSTIFATQDNNIVPPVQEDATEKVNGAVPEDITSQPQEEADKHTASRPSTASKRSPTPKELNATVGVLAGALGAVGVHHVGKTLQSVEPDHADASDKHLSSASDGALTSASIKGPGDFDMMYVPEGRISPEERAGKPVMNGDEQQAALRPDPYQEIRKRQLEEHKRYSQQSHEMETPSMYSQKEHSRFPKDMRPVSSQADDSDNKTSVYAPTPEPDDSYLQRTDYPPLPTTVITNRQTPQYVADSPVSPASSKHSNQIRPAVTSEPVPEMPQIKNRYEESYEDRFAPRERGHSKSSSSSSRLLGFTRDAAGRPQTIHQQMAAGEMTDQARKAHSSTPTRPETAQSAASPPRRHLRLRADSEINTYNPENKKQSLEMALKNDETLMLTLTPDVANFRTEDRNQSPRHSQRRVSGDYHRSNQDLPINKPITRSRKVSMEAGRAPQVLAGVRERQVIPSSKNIAPAPQQSTKPRNPLGEPRDAKVDRVSGVRDLADYVRSTGPATADQLPGPLVSRVTTPSTTKQSGPPSTVAAAPPSPVSARKANNRLQARDPRPSRKGESSALIDFIREGPPRQAGDHRINRHVAPFRTTMDSDDLNGLVASLPKNSSENGVPSITTTSNSHTPLVNHEARMGNVDRASSLGPRDADEGMPKKTRTRVKDPYAIDDSDDDLFDEPAPKQTQEESLIDFLRNTAPPPNMTAQPILSATPTQNQTTLMRQPSIDRLKDFVKRSTTPSAAAQSRARAESPHLTQTGTKRDSYRPTQVTHAAHVDRDRANRIANRADGRLSSITSNSTRPTSPPRGVGATADLADYLRNTGPPPSSMKDPEPFILTGKTQQLNGTQVGKQDGGLKKFFSIKGRR